MCYSEHKGGFTGKLCDSGIKRQTMNTIAGQINIDMHPHKSSDADVRIVSSRPLKASKILIGKKPAQALPVIPLMYNVCGTAHSRAALKAIQQSMAVEVDPHVEIARDMVLLIETAREHLMRICLDWPKLFAVDADIQGLAFLSKLTGDFKSSLFLRGRAFSFYSQLDIQREAVEKQINHLEQYLLQHVFAVSPSDWLANEDMAGILKWSDGTPTISASTIRHIHTSGWAAQGSTDCGQLPHIDDKQLLEELDKQDADTFIARPTWQGHCVETTAFSRQAEFPLVQSFFLEFKNALLTRWVARLVELARIPQQLTDMLDMIKKHEPVNDTARQSKLGITQVESARGRLIHRVEIKQGVISNYQIVAPTEWNFHPEGLLSQSLASIRTNDKAELKQIAHLLINVIDPCVAYELRLH